MITQDRCGVSSSPKNTGADEQCLYKPTVGYALAKETQSFASLAAFRTQAAWDTAKEAKDIVVMFSVEKSELANVEATFYESRTLKVETKAARKGIKFTHHLGLCSHSALQSYENSLYTRIYEFTADGDIKGVLQSDGTVKGQSMSSFSVGDIIEPVIEGDPQSSVVDIVYLNPKQLTDNGAIVTPDFDVEDYKGVYPIQLTVEGTPSATELVVRATAKCGGVALTGLVIGDFKAFTAAGASQTDALDSVSAGSGDDANLYTISTTGLVSGSIATNVVTQSLAMYETDTATDFTVS